MTTILPSLHAAFTIALERTDMPEARRILGRIAGLDEDGATYRQCREAYAHTARRRWWEQTYPLPALPRGCEWVDHLCSLAFVQVRRGSEYSIPIRRDDTKAIADVMALARRKKPLKKAEVTA